jgi:hypothetical protein
MPIPFDSTKAIDTKMAILNTNFVFEAGELFGGLVRHAPRSQDKNRKSSYKSSHLEYRRM